MSLWGNSDADESKPKWLSTAADKKKPLQMQEVGYSKNLTITKKRFSVQLENLQLLSVKQILHILIGYQQHSINQMVVLYQQQLHSMRK